MRYDTPGLREGRREFTTQPELQSFMRALAVVPRDSSMPTVQRLELGTSQRGVPLEALVFTRSANAEPDTLLASGRPTVLLVGQQHGDEPAGCEALMVIARQLADGRMTPVLDRINVIVVPRANPDGAEARRRFSASGVDINRDHLLLRTPEAQALARLAANYQPAIVVDSHEYAAVGHFLEKFDAVQRYDALLQYAMTPNVAAFVTRAAEEWFRRPLLLDLHREQLSAEWYYTTSSAVDDKLVSMGGIQADTVRNVSGLRNAVSFLIETRGLGLGRRDIQRRVHAQVTSIISLLASASSRAADLLKLRQFVDNDISAQACKGDVIVDAAPTRTEYRLTLLDPRTGEDKPLTVDWNSALELEPRKSRARPCGYWLAADAIDAVTHLRALGVQVQQLVAPTSAQGNSYQEVSRTPNPALPTGGVSVKAQLVDALIDLPAGSYFVSLRQPAANLAVAALEPDTSESFYANGLLQSLDRIARIRVLPDANLSPLP